MSCKELAKSLIDQIPDSKMYYIVSYLQGAAIPDETPNAETLASIAELENGGGTLFTGNTEELFSELIEDQHARYTILIYKQTDSELQLVRNGTHADLFGL